MVDIFTKYTLSSFIKDKTPDADIDRIVQMWIGSSLGSPKKFLVDNGREFANRQLRDMCENLNIQVLNTVKQSL